MKRCSVKSILFPAVVVAVSWFMAAVPALAEVVRLGIVSEPSLRTEADLLFAELSDLDVELLERDAIDRVLGEQALQAGAMTRDQALRVGQLLKADGLLLMAGGTNDSLTARLVAVDPGVVVWFAEMTKKPTSRDAPPLAEQRWRPGSLRSCRSWR